MALLFSFFPYQAIGSILIKKTLIEEGKFFIQRFSNQEMYLRVLSSVRNKTCFLLGSIGPLEDNLFSFLLLSDTLKKEGARRCIALLPYLAYTRHEREEQGKSQATRWIGNLFQASFIDCVWTLDIHSTLAPKLFPIPIHSSSSTSLFYHALQNDSWKPDIVIAPDLGATERCQEIANLLQIPVALMHKKRDKHKILHLEIEIGTEKKALIVDDILDTGATLLSCCEQIVSKGVKEIRIMISHGLFTLEAWKKLLRWPIYCTNSVQPSKLPNSIRELSIIPLLEEAICQLKS